MENSYDDLNVGGPASQPKRRRRSSPPLQDATNNSNSSLQDDQAPPSLARAVSCDRGPATSTDTTSTHQPGPAGDGALLFLGRRGLLDDDPAVYRGPDRFPLLSDEILLEIFKWCSRHTLTKVARTCKRFQRVSTDECFWRRVDLAGKTLSDGLCGLVLSRGVMVLRAARAAFLSPVFGRHAEAVLAMEVKLQYLDLSNAVFSNVTDLELLLSRCRNLKKVSLEQVAVSDRVCHELCQNRELTTLNLCMATGLTQAGIGTLCRGSPQLQELNLAWTRLTPAALVTFVKHLPEGLRTLNLSGCKEALTDDPASELIRKSRHLKELDLSDNTALTDSLLDLFPKALPRLECLSLSRCYNIHPTCYVVTLSMESLRYLNVFGLLKEPAVDILRRELGKRITVNHHKFSSIARPTVGIKRTSIWNMRVRE